jgi:hypothetical protein
MLSARRIRVTAIMIIVAALTAGGLTALLRPDRETLGRELPGTVLQSSHAQDQGVEIFLRRATFSATAVDVWVDVAPGAGHGSPVGIAPPDASLGGVPASSAFVSDSGSVLLRFELPDALRGRALAIRITAVGGQAPGGDSARVAGNWELAVELPPRAQWDAVRKVESLQPATIDIEGQTILVEAFRTSGATVLRYQLGLGIVQMKGPALKTTKGATVHADRSESRGAEYFAWFEATSFGSPLIVQFESLLVTSTTASTHFVLELTGLGETVVLDADDEWAPVVWTYVGGAPVKVATVKRYIEAEGSSIYILLDGLWNPGLSGYPRVLADSEELRITGVGNYSNPDGFQTDVSAALTGPSLPRRLDVIFGADARSVSAQAELRP